VPDRSTGSTTDFRSITNASIGTLTSVHTSAPARDRLLSTPDIRAESANSTLWWTSGRRFASAIRQNALIGPVLAPALMISTSPAAGGRSSSVARPGRVVPHDRAEPNWLGVHDGFAR
jgi:hypothetical protein